MRLFIPCFAHAASTNGITGNNGDNILTGGEYAIVGRILGPAWGFITLGVNLITITLMYAAISLGLAAYLKREKLSVPMSSAYEDFKEFLLGQ